MKSIKDSYSEVYKQPTFEDTKAKVEEFLGKKPELWEMMELCLSILKETRTVLEDGDYNPDMYAAALKAYTELDYIHNETVPRP